VLAARLSPSLANAGSAAQVPALGMELPVLAASIGHLATTCCDPTRRTVRHREGKPTDALISISRSLTVGSRWRSLPGSQVQPAPAIAAASCGDCASIPRYCGKERPADDMRRKSRRFIEAFQWTLGTAWESTNGTSRYKSHLDRGAPDIGSDWMLRCRSGRFAKCRQATRSRRFTGVKLNPLGHCAFKIRSSGGSEQPLSRSRIGP